MTTVWLTETNPREQRFKNLKAVREALRTLAQTEPIPSVADAIETLKVFERDGFAFLGTAEDEAAAISVLAELNTQGLDGQLDLEPAEAAPDEEESPTEISENAYQTALALLAGRNGNPLEAAAQAKLLAHTTEDAFYAEVIGALMLTFPWLTEMLLKQGILEKGR